MKKKVKSGTYNIGDKNEISIKNILILIMKIMNVNFKIKSKKITKGSTLRRRPCLKKIMKYGYKPKIQLKEGLEKTIDWYLENNEWLDRVTSGAYADYYSSMYAAR